MAKKSVLVLGVYSFFVLGMICGLGKFTTCSLFAPLVVKASDTSADDTGLAVAQDTVIEAGKEYSFITNSQCESSVCYESTGKGYFYFVFCPKNAYGTTLAGDKDSVTKPDTFCGEFALIGEGDTNTYDKGKVYNYNTYKTKSMNLPKGKKATFKVTDYELLTMGDVSISYTIKVVQVTPKLFETEKNDSKKSADQIKKGKTYSGLISYETDHDYFVFKAPKTNKYKIKAWLTDSNYEYSDVSFKAYKGSKLLGDKSVELRDNKVTLYSGKLKKGQKIYIKSNLGFGGNVTYQGDVFYKIKVD